MKYVATLTHQEMLDFTTKFIELELSRFVQITTALQDDQNLEIVTLEDTGATAPMLVASLTDGMLSHWGWSKKFKRVE